MKLGCPCASVLYKEGLVERVVEGSSSCLRSLKVKVKLLLYTVTAYGRVDMQLGLFLISKLGGG
jgi:hypothetical protein